MRLTLALTLTLMSAGCGRDVKPIQNSVPTLVHTLPPASFWICPSDTICRASNDPADIPTGYVCIKQADGIMVCSPGGQSQIKVTPITLPMTRKQAIEHLVLGAGCYGALYAIAGSGGRPGAVAGSGCTLVAGFKEGSDALSGRDSRRSAIVHAITILVGAGAVAAFKH